MGNIIACILTLTIGFLAGMLVRISLLNKTTKRLLLDDDIEITMWKGVLLKDKIFVTSEKKGKQKSFIVLDKKGNVEQIHSQIEDE